MYKPTTLLPSVPSSLKTKVGNNKVSMMIVDNFNDKIQNNEIRNVLSYLRILRRSKKHFNPGLYFYSHFYDIRN